MSDMNIYTQEIYSEVYAVLNMLGESYIKRLPVALYEMIEKEKSNYYTPTYDSNIPLEKQKIKKESISMIALFHLIYWCETDEEKSKLNKILKDNKENRKSELKENSNLENIFNSSKQSVRQEQTIQNQPVTIVQENKNIFLSFWCKIKNLFRKK